ncbi:gastrokine-1-like [Pleurodeles waltl]|uniref:gastrokine-1-like n=1 Tax=Pleurodeles waltl TaxID=8319 RepID=UPI003709C3A1
MNTLENHYHHRLQGMQSLKQQSDAGLFSVLSVSLTNRGNDGGDVHQTVNIDNHDNIANINTNAGWNSWNSVWDYGNGFVATRVFAKKVCYVNRLNKNLVPSIQQLAQFTKDKKAPQCAPPRTLQYAATKTPAQDLARYGKPIEVLCRGIPTYLAEEVQGASFFQHVEGCLNAGILHLLDINICIEGLLL